MKTTTHGTTPLDPPRPARAEAPARPPQAGAGVSPITQLLEAGVVSHHPAHRDTLKTWARETIGSAGSSPYSQWRACQVIIALSQSASEREAAKVIRRDLEARWMPTQPEQWRPSIWVWAMGSILLVVALAWVAS